MSVGWDRVTDLFGAARLLEPAERRAFLDLACSHDAGLRTQVDALLAADIADDNFLESQPPFAAAVLQGADPLLVAGTVLNDRYVIEEGLGAGGHALVYVAKDRVLSRRVVVKVLRTARLHTSSLKLRFEQEMEALSRLDHPAVVGILDVGELSDRSPFLVIQYIDGVSLRDLLRDGALEPLRAANIIRGVGAALGAAHAAGIAHRDLKPENVMVQRLADGVEGVKLIDFGIAKIERSELTPDVTTVMVEGSVRYMAPEQFDGRNSPASDTYSFGLVACELLCGYPDPRALPTGTDGAVKRLIDSAVAFHPEDRPRDLKRWADDLAAGLLRKRGRIGSFAHAVIIGTVAILMSALTVAFLRAPDGAGERIIEKVGAFDPLREGFQVHNEVAGTVVRNADNTAFIGWSVASSSPGGGYYFRRLSEEQKRRALARGWTLSAIMKTNEGGGFVVVDLGENGRRFDINVLRDGDHDVIRLNTRIVPVLQGLDVRMPHAADTFYKCELRFDPGLQAADLWVNGEQRVVGYRGHTEFQDDMGLSFGAAPYKGARAMASFQGVRFEINP